MSPTSHRARAGLDLIVVLAFLAALASPAVDMLVRDDAARGPAPEMRSAAPMPAFPVDVETLSKFPAAFEAHFDDTFGLRDKLLRAQSCVLYYGFGRSPAKDIVVGRDGWLFWAGDMSMEVFRGVAPLSSEELAGWQFMLESRKRALAKHGCDYVWVVAPNKETIYPEHLPSALKKLGPSRLDQFTAWMKTRSDVDVLDLRPAMFAEKQNDSGPYDVLSTPFGTHWTGRGSIAAARAIVGDLARRHPEAAPFEAADIHDSPAGFASDSIAGQLYMADILRSPDRMAGPRAGRSFTILEQQPGPPQHVVLRSSAHDVLPATVMFHDSFGPFLWPLLAAECASLETWGERYDPHRVDPEKTRIVIELFVERALVTQSPDRVTPVDVVGSNERFEALPRVAFDLSASPAAVTPLAKMPVEHVDSDGRPALRITQQSERQGLELGPITLPAQGDVLVRVEVDSPSAGLLDIAWRPQDHPKYLRRDRTAIALEEGRTQVIVKVPALGTAAILLVRPQETDVPITLRAFVVRCE
jgi:alginate O-acetyltransferase complex protein AlgJ